MAARALVYTASNRKPVMPIWARPLFLTGSASVPVVTWDHLDLRTVDVAGKEVVIVGGGMMSALLAVGAVAKKARSVTLITRRRLKCQPFECEVGWWGNKMLNGYKHMPDPVMRLKVCKAARKQATINLPMWQSMVELAASGKLEVWEECEVVEASTGRAGKVTEAAACGSPHNRGTGNGACMLRLKSRARVAADAADPGASPTTQFAQDVAAATSGPARHATTKLPHSPEGAFCLQADAVWIACGAAYNGQAGTVLSKLHECCASSFVGGYPLIDDFRCVWPGAPLYLIGRAAMLAVGPCAGVSCMLRD